MARRASRSGTPSAARPWPPGHEAFAWMRRLLSWARRCERPGTLVRPAPDLNGDGTGDIVLAFAGTPSLLALSGKDGSMLWTYTAASMDPAARIRSARPSSTKPSRKLARQAAGTPNRPSRAGGSSGRRSGSRPTIDGVPDLLALSSVRRPTGSAFSSGVDGSVTHFVKNRPGRRVLAAISGRTGRAVVQDTRASESRPWLWDRRTPVRHPRRRMPSQRVTVVPGRKGRSSCKSTARDGPARPGDREDARPADRLGLRPHPAGPACGPRRRRSPEVLALGTEAERNTNRPWWPSRSRRGSTSG